MRPTRNAQGDFHFYSLDTGRIFTANSWSPLPMPPHVIDWIQKLSRRTRLINQSELITRHGEEDTATLRAATIPAVVNSRLLVPQHNPSDSDSNSDPDYVDDNKDSASTDINSDYIDDNKI